MKLAIGISQMILGIALSYVLKDLAPLFIATILSWKSLTPRRVYKHEVYYAVSN